jgi:hypothetical protein
MGEESIGRSVSMVLNRVGLNSSLGNPILNGDELGLLAAHSYAE